MGILNVTPDSFSDGGRFTGIDAAVSHGLAMEKAGADILDIGGESTRPGAEPVSEREELERVMPVIERLAGAVKVPISVDTYKPRVAALALRAGASLINDIGATLENPDMVEVLAGSNAGYVAMHMQGTPRSMQMNPQYADVVGTVRLFFETCMKRLTEGGISAGRVALDVGIGFGKTAEHNLQLLARIQSFTDLGRPLLLGVSRKSFIGRIANAPLEARLPGGLAAACLAVHDGVSVIRTHDVAETVQALRVTEAIIANRKA